MSVNVQPLKTGAFLATLLVGLLASPRLSQIQASYLPSGRVVFDRSPELVDMVALESTLSGTSQVQVVLTVPIDAGEPLEALMISPRDGDAYLAFDPEATTALVGKTPSEMAAVSLTSVGGTPLQSNEVLVVFSAPVQPGNQITVLLTSKTRYVSGGYEFGVTAYPAGDNPVGQFLGYEQLEF